jgi:hypothetical protein
MTLPISFTASLNGDVDLISSSISESTVCGSVISGLALLCSMPFGSASSDAIPKAIEN